MGLLFESGDIDILEPVLEEKSECRLETEVYLPDYLPDIQKLLRCEIIPRVASRDMLAGRIAVEGEAEGGDDGFYVVQRKGRDVRGGAEGILAHFRGQRTRRGL